MDYDLKTPSSPLCGILVGIAAGLLSVICKWKFIYEYIIHYPRDELDMQSVSICHKEISLDFSL